MDKKLEKLYRKALKEVAKDAREISGGKIAPHLRVATKSHAEQLAKSRLRLGLGSPSPSAYDLGRRKAKEHIDTYLPHSSADQARWFRENIRDSEETLKIRDKKGLPTQFESAFLKTLIEAEKKHTFGSPLPSTKSGKKTAKTCKHCDEKSLPGLKITPGLCQYHWNAGIWGKEWADKCRTDAQGKKPKALGYNKPKMLGEHDPIILEGMARGPYSIEWANKKEEKGHTFRGKDIYEIAPRTPSFAKKWAKELREQILSLNNAPSLTYLYEFAKSKGYKNVPEIFGFHLGMESIGHGLSWHDDADYRLTKPDDIKLPHTGFYF